MTDLTQNNLGAYSRAPIFGDPVLQTGGILIDQDAYTAALTYTYDVRGLNEAYFEVNNEGSPANSLDYTIEKCRKNFTNLTDLVDGDFDEDAKAETAVASGANQIVVIFYTHVDLI
jgi:hypothetical protein